VIVDTSALIAILFDEPEAVRFLQLIHGAERCAMSVVSRVELAIVLDRQASPECSRQAEVLLREARVVVEPVTIEQGWIAQQAFYDFGRGRHRAALNFGDCFSYALAKVSGEALLFKGEDFSRTDIQAAHRTG